MSVVSASARRALVLALLPTAVATALVLAVLRVHFQPPTLPRYVETSESEAVEGGTLAAHGRFEMAARPATPMSGAVGARGFLLKGDEVRPWDPPLSVSIDGVVRVAGSVDQLFAGVPAGTWEVAIAVGRPEFLPTAPRDVLRARDHRGETESWQLLVKRITLP